jgi:excisionase family DNA binding protein
METLENALTRQETVEATGLSLRVIDKLIASGELPAAKIGRRVVIQPRHVRELLENNIRETSMRVNHCPDRFALNAIPDHHHRPHKCVGR